MTASIGSLNGSSLTAGYGNSLSDPDGTLQAAGGGNSSALNVTAATVIKATPGRICKISVLAAGTTSGAFTVNDCAATADAAAGNQVWSMAYNATANVVGAVFTLDFPCRTGIVVSAVPGGGSPQLAISFH